MINLLFTLLTLAAGMLVGSAGVFLSKRNFNHILKALLWIVVMCPLLVVGMEISLWFEKQVHPHSLIQLLSKLVAVVIYAYGIFLSITIHFRNEVKEALKDAGKIEWITASCTKLLQQLPIILWAIFLFSPWDFYTSIAVAIGISLIAVTVFYFVLNFAWVLKYGFCNTAP